MAQIRKPSRLKADSLLEVIIAAVLIVIIFGIAMMVYSNVLRASRPVKQVRAAAFLRKVAMEIEQRQDTVAADAAYENVRIGHSLSATDVPGTRSLKLTAVDNGKDTVATLSKIILWHEN